MHARTRFIGTVFALATALGQCSGLGTLGEDLGPTGDDPVIEDGGTEADPSELDDTGVGDTEADPSELDDTGVGDTEADPTEIDETVGTGVETDVFQLTVGSCVNTDDLDGIVETVPVVPCDQPHDSEAFASTDMPAGPYPGDAAVDAAAADFCYPELEAFVGVPYLSSTLDYWPLTPSVESWEAVDDRQLLCFVYDPAGTVTGTLADAQR